MKRGGAVDKGAFVGGQRRGGRFPEMTPVAQSGSPPVQPNGGRFQSRGVGRAPAAFFFRFKQRDWWRHVMWVPLLTHPPPPPTQPVAVSVCHFQALEICTILISWQNPNPTSSN